MTGLMIGNGNKCLEFLSGSSGISADKGMRMSQAVWGEGHSAGPSPSTQAARCQEGPRELKVNRAGRLAESSWLSPQCDRRGSIFVQGSLPVRGLRT